MSETQIAKIEEVHRNTIVRDVAYLKASSRNWLDDLAKDGFIYEYHLAMQKIRDHERQLQDLLMEAQTVPQKIQILQALDANTKLYLELLGETPTVHAYRRAISLTSNSGSDDLKAGR